MRPTKFSDYPLCTLITRAAPKPVGQDCEIAAAYSISANHLTKVVHHAAPAGELQTVGGQNGGLRLGQTPEAISVGRVLRRMEPDFHIAACFGSETGCRIQPARAPAKSLSTSIVGVPRGTR
jgi:Rrf2 family nitric oxide-sensitive transcriptional repressor